jgi:L-2-hydroxyglutarate oxidase LhgO
VAALHSPHTGIVDFGAVAQALAADVREAGGTVTTGTAVDRVEEGRSEVVVHHAGGATTARAALVCAGAWADRLAVAAGGPADPRIVPFRGAYLRLKPERRSLVKGLIYPVPDPQLPFLGVHLTRHIGGEVLIGPTALLAPARDAYSLRTVRPKDLRESLGWPGTRRMARRFWRTGATELGYAVSRRRLVRAASRVGPELALSVVVDGPAGVRAQAGGRDGRLIDDFVFSRTGRTLHVRNAPSPAATAALAIAREVADRADPLIRGVYRPRETRSEPRRARTRLLPPPARIHRPPGPWRRASARPGAREWMVPLPRQQRDPCRREREWRPAAARPDRGGAAGPARAHAAPRRPYRGLRAQARPGRPPERRTQRPHRRGRARL